MTMQLEEEQVRLRAYTLWEARGRPDGGPEEDWLAAEQQLKMEHEATATPLAPLAARAADVLEPDVLEPEPAPARPKPSRRSGAGRSGTAAPG